MPDLDVLRVMLGAIVGLGAAYFMIPDGADAPERAQATRRGPMAEHLAAGHRGHQADCPPCDFDRHRPVG
jgi:hypothetical protein